MKYKTIGLIISLIIPFGVTAEESSVPRTSDIDMEDIANLRLINDTESYFVNYCHYTGPSIEFYKGQMLWGGPLTREEEQLRQHLSLILRVPKSWDCPKAIKVEHSKRKGWEISDKITRMLQVDHIP